MADKLDSLFTKLIDDELLASKPAGLAIDSFEPTEMDSPDWHENSGLSTSVHIPSIGAEKDYGDIGNAIMDNAIVPTGRFVKDMITDAVSHPTAFLWDNTAGSFIDLPRYIGEAAGVDVPDWMPSVGPGIRYVEDNWMNILNDKAEDMAANPEEYAE